MLGVNRPTVREAIKSLGFLGLLEVRQSSGTCVRGTDSDVLYRLGAELLRARLSAIHECPDEAFPEADTAFHTALAERCCGGCGR